jgi:hypothetical protein
MIWILLLAVLVVVGYFAFKSTEETPALKIKSGAKEAIDSAKAGLEKVADVNKDGKVDMKDAMAAVQNVKAEVKRVKKKYGGKVKKTK